MAPERRSPERQKPIEVEDKDIVEAREIAPEAKPAEFEIDVELSLADLTERAKRAFLLEAKFANTRERLEQTPELSFEEVAARLFERAGERKKEFRAHEARVGELKEKLRVIYGRHAEDIETAFLHDWERVNQTTAFVDILDGIAEEIKREPNAEFAAILLERHAVLVRLFEQLGEEAQMVLYDITRHFQKILEQDADALAKDRLALVTRFTIERQRLSDTAEALHTTIYKKESEPRELALVGMERFDDPELGSAREQIERLVETYGVKDVFSQTVATLAHEDRTRDLSVYKIAGTAAGEYDYSQKAIRLLKNELWERPKVLESKEGVGMILHEWAHSTDPTLQGLRRRQTSAADSLEEIVSDVAFITDWERVIGKDQRAVTRYVAEIVHKGNPAEARFREDWAESMTLFLHVPSFLEKHNPERYRFCLEWAQKHLPDFSMEKHLARLQLAVMERLDRPPR